MIMFGVKSICRNSEQAKKAFSFSWNSSFARSRSVRVSDCGSPLFLFKFSAGRSFSLDSSGLPHVDPPPQMYINNNDYSLQGKVAVVMGGSGAIGRSIAHQLLIKGATVVLSSSDLSKCEKAKTEILLEANKINQKLKINKSNNNQSQTLTHSNDIKFNSNLMEGQASEEGLSSLSLSSCASSEEFSIKSFQCDIRSVDSINDFFSKFKMNFDRLDYLIIASGTNQDSLSHNIQSPLLNKLMETNLIGPMNLTKTLLPLIIRTAQKSKKKENDGTGGRIIFIGSIVALKGNVGQSVYGASKAGLIGFSRSVAVEMIRFGITSNVIAPGFVHSEMTQNLPPARREEIIHSIPSKRFAEPYEVANLAMYLCSPYSSYLTGQVLNLDGGINLGM